MGMTDQQWAIWNEVRDRDRGICLLCGNWGHHCHHFLSRQLLRGRDDLLWRVENMGWLCSGCHVNGNTTPVRSRLLHLMAEKYPAYGDFYLSEPEFRQRYVV